MQHNFSCYTYVFDVKQHDWIDLNTAVNRDEWEIKDGFLEPEVHMK